MNKSMNHLMFQGMSFIFMLRDFFYPRKTILMETGIKPGDYVLDYGCGPGGYVAPASKMLGATGRVYALDINPLAIKKVQKIAMKEQLSNVETICSDCKTRLHDKSMDLILLYDIFHILSDPEVVMAELHRVLKLKGTLSFSDHHMSENDILAKMARGGLFLLSKKGKKTYSFFKRD